MEVHKILGKGFLEIVYKDAIEYEFKQKSISYEREKRYEIQYKEIILPQISLINTDLWISPCIYDV
ncbi:MAG: GxxExxY protein [Bacteroidales bacterium]|nr:GxxExxY protein [Bacteroidales bacterium]